MEADQVENTILKEYFDNLPEDEKKKIEQEADEKNNTDRFKSDTTKEAYLLQEIKKHQENFGDT